MAAYELRAPVTAIQFTGTTASFQDLCTFVSADRVSMHMDGVVVDLYFPDDEDGITMEPADYLVKIGDEYEVYTVDAFNRTFVLVP